MQKKKIENSNATFQLIFKHCAFLVHELFEVEDFFEKSQIKNFKNRHWNPKNWKVFLILNWNEKVDKFQSKNNDKLFNPIS